MIFYVHTRLYLYHCRFSSRGHRSVSNALFLKLSVVTHWQINHKPIFIIYKKMFFVAYCYREGNFNSYDKSSCLTGMAYNFTSYCYDPRFQSSPGGVPYFVRSDGPSSVSIPRRAWANVKFFTFEILIQKRSKMYSWIYSENSLVWHHFLF